MPLCVRASISFGREFSSRELGFAGNVNQAVCREAMDHWEEHTCLKFEETSDLSKPHLQFKKLSGCYSYLGRLWWQNGQDVSIGTNCDTVSVLGASCLTEDRE